MQTQFQKGDYVRYAVNGVCLVEDVRKMPELKREDLFYILRPIADRNSMYYIPLSNEQLTAKLRRVLTREEIDALIDSVRESETPWIEDRKTRAEHSHAILRTCDIRELMLLIGSLYVRKYALTQEGKKLSPTDEAVLKQAQALTENEFSFVLQIPVREVSAYVLHRLGIQ